MMFSDRIARLRKDRGLNQAQLAKKLGVDAGNKVNALQMLRCCVT